MSESFLGDLWVHTGGQQMRGVAVAEIVKTYLRQTMPAHELPKRAA
jgi:hypothetical protein